LAAARLAEELGFDREAEQGFRRFLVRSSALGAAAEWPLARFLAAKGRIDDALAACERIGPSAPPEAVALIAAGVARASQLSSDQSKRFERWLDASKQRHPESVLVLMAIADYFEHTSRPADAEAQYALALPREPGNSAALNNYAALLALRGQGAKALDCANKAIQIAGPLPALLDTRGLAHLAAGDAKAAIADFSDAIAQHDTPVRRYHLALAHRAAGNNDRFDENLRIAKDRKLSERGLHPLERARWRELTGT
jgi:Tfp pilus assembly protein PilF